MAGRRAPSDARAKNSTSAGHFPTSQATTPFVSEPQTLNNDANRGQGAPTRNLNSERGVDDWLLSMRCTRWCVAESVLQA